MGKTDIINLRRAGETDLMFFYKLRNEPTVQKMSFDSNPIDLKSHKQWFYQKLKDHNSYLFVIYAMNKRIGQIRIDINDGRGEINIAILPKYRGMGMGSIAIHEACEIIFKKNRMIDTILAHIKPTNIASRKTFQKASFVKNGLINYRNQRCLEMRLKRNGQNSTA